MSFEAYIKQDLYCACFAIHRETGDPLVEPTLPFGSLLACNPPTPSMGHQGGQCIWQAYTGASFALTVILLVNYKAGSIALLKLCSYRSMEEKIT